MKLWLDDERDPKNNIIKSMFGSNGDEVWCKTSQEAIDLLKSGNITSISLDHDLGPAIAGTGLDVAKWIEEKAYHKEILKLIWKIHSMNPIGRSNMENALKNADRFWSV